MKATLKKKDLISHKRRLLTAKSRKRKRTADTTYVVISVAERFSVTGPAFRFDLDCKPIQWGTVSMPYIIWERVIENVVPAIRERKITIEADTFELYVGSTKLFHHEIKVTKLDRVPFEIPNGATPMEIVEYAVGQDYRRIRNSVAWETIRTAIKTVRKQIERACTPVRRYGVETEDIAILVVQNLGIKEYERFMNLVFPDN